MSKSIAALSVGAGSVRSVCALAAISLFALADCRGSNGGDEDGTGENPAESPETVKLFFTAGEQFSPVRHQVGSTGSTPLLATEALLKGPAEIKPAASETDRIETLIPAGTRVENLEVDQAGDATVDLSGEFLGDLPARAPDRTRAENDEVTGRLAQVTYTLTRFHG